MPVVAYVDPTGGLPPSLWGWFLAAAAAGCGVLGLRLRLVAGRMLRSRLVRIGAGLLLAGLVGAVAAMLTGDRTVPLSPTASPTDESDGTGTARSEAGPSDSEPAWPTAPPARGPRLLVLAFDGLDPKLVARFRREGRMPHFDRLHEEGTLHELETTWPPQSPCAWSSFVTASEPGAHGVFDFVQRDPDTYRADLALADRRALALPWTGTPLWELPAIRRLGFVGLRVPMAFPPPRLAGPGRILAGMGVWDVRGTEGTALAFATSGLQRDGTRTPQRDLVRDGTAWRGELPGPYRAGGADEVRVPFVLRADRDRRTATLEIGGALHPLAADAWSGGIPIEFRLGALGLERVAALTRVLWTIEGDDVALVFSAPSFDPRDPAYPIARPADYARELAEAIGPYSTRGMPFDVQAADDGLISDAAFLAQVRNVTDESERMLRHELGRFESGVLFAYFGGSDVVQHLCWRGFDPQDARRDGLSDEVRDAIPRVYAECDAILGRARQSLAADDAVVVLSDHGFAPFRRAVHLNAVLRELGFLHLKEGRSAGGELLVDVDWSRTQVYALGFNAAYVNRIGREGHGIVPESESAAVAARVAERLAAWTHPETGERPFARVPTGASLHPRGADARRPDLFVGYAEGFRASWQTALGAVPEPSIEDNDRRWSGDHCIDPALVPGLFGSSDPRLSADRLQDIGPMLDRWLAKRSAAAK